MIRLARLVYYWFYQDLFFGDWRYYIDTATKAERRHCRQVIRQSRTMGAP